MSLLSNLFWGTWVIITYPFSASNTSTTYIGKIVDVLVNIPSNVGLTLDNVKNKQNTKSNSPDLQSWVIGISLITSSILLLFNKYVQNEYKRGVNSCLTLFENNGILRTYISFNYINHKAWNKICDEIKDQRNSFIEQNTFIYNALKSNTSYCNDTIKLINQTNANIINKYKLQEISIWFTATNNSITEINKLLTATYAKIDLFQNNKDFELVFNKILSEKISQKKILNSLHKV